MSTCRGLHSTLVIGSLASALILAASIRTSGAADDVFAAYKESGTVIPGAPIVTLKGLGGNYAILAKINLDQDDVAYDHWVTVVCTLKAGADLDVAVIRLQPSGNVSMDNATISLQLVESFVKDTVNDVVLSCTFDPLNSSLLSFRFARITALRLDGGLCEKESPAECP